MPTVTYVGSGDRTDDVTCDVFGLSFRLNEPIEMDVVPAKLRTNPTFTVEGADKKARAAKAVTEPTAEEAAAAEAAAAASAAA